MVLVVDEVAADVAVAGVGSVAAAQTLVVAAAAVRRLRRRRRRTAAAAADDDDARRRGARALAALGVAHWSSPKNIIQTKIIKQGNGLESIILTDR